jgi:hypothetical protein
MQLLVRLSTFLLLKLRRRSLEYVHPSTPVGTLRNAWLQPWGSTPISLLLRPAVRSVSSGFGTPAERSAILYQGNNAKTSLVIPPNELEPY